MERKGEDGGLECFMFVRPEEVYSDSGESLVCL